MRLEKILRTRKSDYELNLMTVLGPIPAADHTTGTLYWPENTVKPAQFLEIVGRMQSLRLRAGKYKTYHIVIMAEPDREAERHANVLDEAGIIQFRKWPKD